MKYLKTISILTAGAMLLAPIQASAASTAGATNLNSPEAMESYLQSFIKENFKDPVTDEKLNEAKLKGMFDSLDPYSNYYTKEEYKILNESLSGSFVGIGVHIEPFEGYLRVTKPVTGGPAEKAGIQIGDVITKVDGTSISGMLQEKAISMIKGEEKTTVRITVLKNGTNKEVTYNLIRAVIKVETVVSKILPNHIGYVSLSEFDTTSASDVISAIQKMDAKGIKGLVLDLRDNPGGYLSQAIQLSDFFLPKDAEIMSIDYKNLDDEVVTDQKDGYRLPLVVLVNNNSASASEIVTAALQKNGRAKVVGVTSYGKGTVQDVIGLPEGDGFKLTVAEYRGPKQMKINGVGVKPDYEVKLNDIQNAEAYKLFVPMAEQKSYKAGTVGLNVYGAQQRLNFNGNQLKLTATMDIPTVNAIKTWQKSNKLVISGILDDSTKKSLEEKSIQLYNRIISDKQLDKAVTLLSGL